MLTHCGIPGLTSLESAISSTTEFKDSILSQTETAPNLNFELSETLQTELWRESSRTPLDILVNMITQHFINFNSYDLKVQPWEHV